MLFPDAARDRTPEPAGAIGWSQASDYTRQQRLRYEQEILEVCVSGHPLDRFARNGEVWSTDILHAVDALRGARSGGRSFSKALQEPLRCHPESAEADEGSAFPHTQADSPISGVRWTPSESQNRTSPRQKAPGFGMTPFQNPARRRALLIGQRVTLLGWVITFRRVGTKNYRNMMFVTCEDQRGLYEVVLFPPAYERYGGLVFETRLLRVTGRVEPDGQINCEKLEALRS